MLKQGDSFKFAAYCAAGYHPLEAARLVFKERKTCVSPETKKALGVLNNILNKYRHDSFNNQEHLNGSPGNASDSSESTSFIDVES